MEILGGFVAALSFVWLLDVYLKLDKNNGYKAKYK